MDEGMEWTGIRVADLQQFRHGMLTVATFVCGPFRTIPLNFSGVVLVVA
jgi:hypothetical protein